VAVREKLKVRPLAAPERITITVGVHGDDGAEAHVAGASFAADGAFESSQALTVADVGRFHEFGVSPFQMPSGAVHPGIPQRSFVRGWFDESQDFIRETMRSQMQLVIAGKLTTEKAMARIALAYEGSIKQRISRGIPPPLAASTIKAKGSSKQLIHRGQLRAAVRGKGSIG